MSEHYQPLKKVTEMGGLGWLQVVILFGFKGVAMQGRLSQIVRVDEVKAREKVWIMVG